jgi:MYXO-CTERM domain-containing protein
MFSRRGVMRLLSRSGLIATVIASAAIAAPSALASGPGLGLSGVAGSPAVVAHEEGQSYLLRPASVTMHEVPSTAKRASTDPGSQGFQLDDAAIGAGAMAGLTLLGLGGAFAVRRRNQLIQP